MLGFRVKCVLGDFDPKYKNIIYMYVPFSQLYITDLKFYFLKIHKKFLHLQKIIFIYFLYSIILVSLNFSNTAIIIF